MIKNLSKDEAIKCGVEFVSEDRCDMLVHHHCERCAYDDQKCTPIVLHGCRSGQCGYWRNKEEIMENAMYYVYGEKDPHCSCCGWEYCNEEFDVSDVEKMKKYVNDQKEYGFSITVVFGEEVQI